MTDDNKVRMVEHTIFEVRTVLGMDDEDPVLRLDMIEGETDALDLVSKIIVAYREEKQMAAALRDLARMYTQRAQASDARVKRMKTALSILGEAIGLDRVRVNSGTLYRRRLPPRPFVTNINMLYEAFPNLVKRELKPRVPEIAEEIEKGTELPGVDMSNGSESWSIR